MENLSAPIVAFIYFISYSLAMQAPEIKTNDLSLTERTEENVRACHIITS